MRRLRERVLQREPGFRLNLTDIALIGMLCAVSAGLYGLFPDVSLFLVPPYLGLSFFLFCNAFRIGNRIEALWYIPFTVAVLYGVVTLNMGAFWLVVLCFLEPWKWALIVYRIKKGPYVGVMCNRMKDARRTRSIDEE